MKFIAAGITGEMADAEDIVQHAYSIAIEKNQSFDSRDKFLGWSILPRSRNLSLIEIQLKQQRRLTPRTWNQ